MPNLTVVIPTSLASILKDAVVTRARSLDNLARTVLVQCALIAMRFSFFLQNFYQRIQRRRGGGKANIALARKFLGITYHTLKNNWVFEDFPNFVLDS